MTEKDALHKDRVNQAIFFQRPDRVPRDFAAVPEIWKGLGDYFGTEDRNETLKRLDVDCRIVSYDSFCQHPESDFKEVNMEVSQERSSVSGMWRKVEPDGSNRDIWGAHRKKVQTRFGALDQFASFPLESAQSLGDLENYQWPQPDWWDFENLRSHIEQLNDTAVEYAKKTIDTILTTVREWTG